MVQLKSRKRAFAYAIFMLVSIFLIHYFLMVKNSDAISIMKSGKALIESLYMTITLFPICYLLIWIDIKKRIILEEKLLEAVSAKDKLFTIIAHDLKNPFSGFIGLTQDMAENTSRFTVEDLESTSKMLHASTKNLYELLENLLEWSKMQKGITAYTPCGCRLSEIVEHGIAELAHSTAQKEIKIINSVRDTVRIFVDVNMINSVMRNLLSNAIKFSRRGGEVIISSEIINSATVEISVLDNGIGMSESLCGKIFTTGEIVGRKGTENEPSSGLGLLLCKEFVEKNGGRIWTMSVENHGSIFKFTLPLRKAAN